MNSATTHYFEGNYKAYSKQFCKLTEQLAEIGNNVSVFESTSDEPILQRVLNTTEMTSEVISLIGRIIVYDNEHIEIQFSFGDPLSCYGKTE